MDDATRTNSLDTLPDDPALLKGVIATVVRERDAVVRRCDAVVRERDKLQASTLRLEADKQGLQLSKLRLETDKQALQLIKLRLETELLRLKKWLYGPRADRLRSIADLNQMLLSFATDLEKGPVDAADLLDTAGTPQENAAATAECRRVKRKPGRRNLADFDNLPLVRCEHDLTAQQKLCPCCGKDRARIGAETTWQLEYIPGHFKRFEHVQLKYGCKHCDQSAAPKGPQIVLADKPRQPIDKGMAGPGLLAYVVGSKFSLYLPLYRLEDLFKRTGCEISRSTLSVWCRDVANLIKPLYDLMVKRTLASHVLHTDDTIMPMQAKDKAANARMWVYVGDQDNPYNIFDFTLSRSRDGPAKFLKEYKQVLVADGYGGYNAVVVGNEITRAGCWAHARRKFVEAELTDQAIATEAVGLIKRLYAIEERGKPLDTAARRDLRQRETVPVLAVLRDRLFTWRDKLLPKHPMALAVGYALNQWKELNAFAIDGAIPIDNNVSEREMKRIVLNRKNSLFVGNERGGRTAAILSSFTSTCKRHAIDPQRYFTQLLTNLPDTPMSALETWLPDHWKRRDAPPPE